VIHSKTFIAKKRVLDIAVRLFIFLSFCVDIRVIYKVGASRLHRLSLFLAAFLSRHRQRRQRVRFFSYLFIFFPREVSSLAGVTLMAFMSVRCSNEHQH